MSEHQPSPRMNAQTTVVRVALDVPLLQQFEFLAPGCSTDDVGCIVAVPFGRGERQMAGVIVGVVEPDAPAETAQAQLKSILFVQRGIPALPAETLALAKFCAGYYHATLGQVLMNLLPPAHRKVEPWQRREAPLAAVKITDAGREALASATALPPQARALRSLLTILSGTEQLAVSDLPVSRAVLRRALAEKWVTTASARSGIAKQGDDGRFVRQHALNAQQASVVAEVSAAMRTAAPAPFLLAGITGSGKTEVYLHLVAEALAHGKQALVLVPEINLTPALLAHIRGRFPGSNIVEAHSGMAAITRANQFIAAQTGAADIVVGTRLAVFTPMPRLGLIVVDEEHDASFKQQEGVRYHARDLAIYRAHQARCVVVLGSATPSLESFENAARGRFRGLTLSKRASGAAELPSVDLVDLDKERHRDGLTHAAMDAIEGTLARGEQALVFINRRGFAPALVCTQCGWIPHCTQCSARLVFHRSDRRLRCHHCAYSTAVPKACGECGNQELIGAGEGSERIEDALRTRFPTARIARVDRDALRRKGSAERVFAAAAAGELDILVGTQMLAKGHDFPKLTLVCVVNSDSAVFSADFRAPERVLAQLVQVAGRAGRADRPGRVLVQTRFVTHPLYQTLQTHDYNAFAKSALEERRFARFPPFGFLTMLRAESNESEALTDFMARAQALVRKAAGEAEISIWEPTHATLARKAGYERQQLLLQSNQRSVMQRVLSDWLALLREEKFGKVKWIIDVDPIEV